MCQNFSKKTESLRIIQGTPLQEMVNLPEKEFKLKAIRLYERETGRIIIGIKDDGEDLLRIYDYESFMTALRREMDRVIQGEKKTLPTQP